jgi:ABC-2 type transport system ATP-binding protein
MIDVQHLTKRFGDFAAVNDLTFSAQPGEIVGFLGPNGAGKTTTLRILSGFMPPTAGTAIVAGFDVVRDSLEARRRTGYLPESVPLYPDMTVRGYLDFVADLRRVPGRRARIAAVLEQVGMTPRAGSLIRTLSRGMRQRVGLAQALIHDPPVLILDEPTVGLDPHQVIDVRALVRELGRERTLIFSTHILSEAEQVCDRVLILQRGQIVAEGPPDRLREQLQRGARILLRLGGQPDPATVARRLGQVPGVASVEPSPEGFLIEPRAGADIRGAVNAAAVQAGWAVVELRTATGSLEDIFLEVTSADVSGPGKPDGLLKSAEGSSTPGGASAPGRKTGRKGRG